jgi:hypothetical protein
MISNDANNLTSVPVGLVQFSDWYTKLPVSRATAYRIVGRGWIRTIKVGKRVFVTQQAISDFEVLAANGGCQLVT